MAITKQAIRDFLKEKREQIVKEKYAPLVEERDLLKRIAKIEALEKINEAEKLNIDDFVKKYLDLAKDAAKIRDSLSLYWGDVKALASDATTTEDEFVSDLLEVFSNSKKDIIKYPDRVLALNVDIQAISTRISDQFRKLEAMVKNNNAKQCIILLKEAGFDTDDLESRFSTPKNEVKALDIDNDLLNLPEKKGV